MNIAKQWIRMTEAVCVQHGTYKFFVPQAAADQDLFRLLTGIDQNMMSGKKLKDSRTTTAVLLTGSRPLFIKRTNNKDLQFTLRYLFRSARAFRAAYAAELFRRLDIPTPAVFAAGESRSGLILNCGYLVTEAVSNAGEIADLVASSPEPLAEIRRFFAAAGEMMQRLHEKHLIHGDLKIHNFYLSGATYGIWDLDGVRSRSPLVMKRKITQELALLVASTRIALEQNPVTENLTNLTDLTDYLTGLLLENYETKISRTAVAAAAIARYNRMMFRYFGKSDTQKGGQEQ